MLYLSQDTHLELLYTFIQSGSALSVVLYFTLKDVLTKYTSLNFSTLSTHLLNKQMVFFDKNVSVVLLFYNYSSDFTHYGSYRTVELFDPLMQNTIIVHTAFKMNASIGDICQASKAL